MATALSDRLRDGITAVHTRDFDRARVLLDRALSETPDSPLVWFWMAMASTSAGAAMSCLRRVLQLDPTHVQARTGLIKLLLASAEDVRETDRAKAAALLTEATTIAPNATAVWIALADVEETDEARLAALRRVVALAPHRADMRAKLHEGLLHAGVAAAKTRNRTAAKACFDEATELNPRDARVWEALAHLATTTAEVTDALTHVLDIEPENERARSWLNRLQAPEPPAPPAPVAPPAPPAPKPRSAPAPAAPSAASPAAPTAAPKRSVTKPAADVAPPVIARAPAPAVARRTVMVVDDSPTIRKILALTLERAGYAVVAEADGESAVSRLSDLTPDLILLDITMPKLDGYEVCKRIKKDQRLAHVPVVMLSGKDGFFDKVKGRMAGATEYLTKPFQAPAVLAVIARHCQSPAEVANG